MIQRLFLCSRNAYMFKQITSLNIGLTDHLSYRLTTYVLPYFAAQLIYDIYMIVLKLTQWLLCAT
jgi:hypothetical protein